MKNKSKIMFLGIIALMFATSMFLTGCAGQDDDVIKIGYISALSGDAGVWGQSLRKGFDYGLSQYNEQEDRKYTIVAVYEDDACEPTAGINAFNKVINFQGIKYVTGTVCSNVAMAVSNIVSDNDVIYIASGATNPDVVKQGETIFRLWPDDAYDAKVIAEYALNELQHKTFSIGYVNDNPIGATVKNSFIDIVESFGGDIFETENYESKNSDFRTIATKLILGDPDAIYIQALPEQLVIFIKQIRDLNYEGSILLYGPSATSAQIIEKIDNKENLYYAIPDDVQQTNFWKEYEDETGEKADSLVGLGYDSFDLIKNAIENCGNDTECAKEYILNIDKYETTRGTFSFNEHGDITNVPFKVIKVE